MFRLLSIILTAALIAAQTAAAQDTASEFHADVPEADDSGNELVGAMLPTAWEGSHLGSETSCTPAKPLLCGDSGDPWSDKSPLRIQIGVPGWLPEVHGSATIRGVDAPVYVTTRKLFDTVDDVNFAAVGRVKADAGRFGVIADGLYVNISGGKSFLGDRIDASAAFEQAIVDAAFTYDIQDELFDGEAANDVEAELLAGARYWLVGGSAEVTGPRGNTVSATGTRQWVDPIVGGQFAAPLNDSLLMRLRADVGGFGAASDFSWNVEAVGEYRCSQRCGLQVGYRVLDVDYARGNGFGYDVNYRGPIATLAFNF